MMFNLMQPLYLTTFLYDDDDDDNLSYILSYHTSYSFSTYHNNINNHDKLR